VYATTGTRVGVLKGRHLNAENFSELCRLFSLTGKTALVTGATGGIGEMIATGLAKAGADVIITGRKRDTLDAAVQRIGAFGACRGVHCDVSTPEGVDELASRIGTESLHILINNAGTTWGAQFSEFPDKAWPKVMGVNVYAPFMLAQRLHPLLASGASPADPARIINIGSIFGVSTDVASAYSYSASKAAVHQLSRVLARDLCADHINVNAIAPGYFPSRMTAFISRDPELSEQVEAAIPMGRQGGPDDIAGAVIYLCSRAGSYVTGVVLPVDGGRLLS